MDISFKQLDVRPLLARGEEPFQAIMSAVDGLAPEEGLALITPFRPLPLLSALERKGYRHEIIDLDDGAFQVLFRPLSAGVMTSPDFTDEDDWPEPSRSFDFSDLDPPQAMERILAQLESMMPGAVLFAVLGRKPEPVLNELSRRGYTWAGNYDRTGSAFRIMVKRSSIA